MPEKLEWLPVVLDRIVLDPDSEITSENLLAQCDKDAIARTIGEMVIKNGLIVPSIQVIGSEGPYRHFRAIYRWNFSRCSANDH